MGPWIKEMKGGYCKERRCHERNHACLCFHKNPDYACWKQGIHSHLVPQWCQKQCLLFDFHNFQKKHVRVAAPQDETGLEVALQDQMFSVLRIFIPCPAWCGSVDWILACKPGGHWFDSLWEHMPGLQARSPVGACERQPHTDVSLPLFLLPSSSLSLSK